MIIGTAGHIDHGKTALIKRLTGIDTDRLPEEKRREMTIELGFAHFDLEGLGRVGIVDVPGHERFIHTMVAGATGIDLVLLVVAADDGVMPQTREHLDIVSLLGIVRGVVALNKVDLVDEAQVHAVTEEIHAVLHDTPLHTAPIVPVSAQTGEGVESLRQELVNVLKEVKARQVADYFRLAVDRVFAMPGFGPVVTGTVASGQVKKGDHLTLLPGGKRVRVRGIQAHNESVETISAGGRCALNLVGVTKELLQRGMMVCDPRLQRAAHTVDVSLSLVPGLSRIPKSHQRMRFHSGTAETFARLVWLGDETPEPGQAGLAQFRLEQAVPLLYGDRFVVRNETAQHTLGGGVVLDPFAQRRGVHHPGHLDRLIRLRGVDSEQSLNLWLEARGADGWRLPELAEQLAELPEKLEQRLKERTDLWREEASGASWVGLKREVEALMPHLLSMLEQYLQEHPRVTAMPLATLHARVCPRLELAVFRELVARLVTDGQVESVADGLRPLGHRQHFSASELALAERIEATLAYRGKTPPKLEALASAVGQLASGLHRFLSELERAGRVVQVARGVYLTQRDLEDWRERALVYIRHHGSITLAQFRDEIGCGRELAMQVLEYLDRTGVTRREGNTRVAVSLPEQEKVQG
jgi:selenocysteine-specific elongation factor